MLPRFPFPPRFTKEVEEKDEDDSPGIVPLDYEGRFRQEMIELGYKTELIEMGVKMAKGHMLPPAQAYEIGRNYIKEMSR